MTTTLKNRLAFQLACAYGRLAPFRQRKWQICLRLLRAGGVHPWENASNWHDLTRDLTSQQICVDGLQLQCNWHDDLAILLTRMYEPYLCRVARTAIRRGDSVVDVGANIGFLSMVFAEAAGDDGEVHAFEPLEYTRDKLRLNFALNPRLERTIRVHGFALSDGAGKQDLLVPSNAVGDTPEIGQSTLVATTGEAKTRDISKIEVNVRRLDDIVSDNGVTFIKIDVEGAELLVLNGAASTIAANKPIVALELNCGDGTYSFDQIYRFLRQFGDYQAFAIRHSGLIPIGAEHTLLGADVLFAIREYHESRIAPVVRRWQ